MTAHHIRCHLPASSTEQPKEATSMSNVPTSEAQGPGRYEIRVQGHLEPRWAARFDGMTLTTEVGGITCIHGTVADQAALHGLLAKLRDVGLPLISVIHAEPDQPDAATPQSR
jgi:hypothetical protein